MTSILKRLRSTSFPSIHPPKPPAKDWHTNQIGLFQVTFRSFAALPKTIFHPFYIIIPSKTNLECVTSLSILTSNQPGAFITVKRNENVTAVKKEEKRVERRT